jgi:hypothetical protein
MPVGAMSIAELWLKGNDLLQMKLSYDHKDGS